MQPGRIDTVFSFFEYLFTRLRTKHAVSSSRPSSRREVRFEVLEPRLLLSADPATVALAADQLQQEDHPGSPAAILPVVEPADRIFLSFDGNDRVEVDPDNDTSDNDTLALTGSSTVEIRFRYDAPVGDPPLEFMPLLYKGGGTIDTRTYSLWINDASGQLLLTTADEQYLLRGDVDQSVSAGEWHDLATVIDRATGAVIVYLDGQELLLDHYDVSADEALPTDEPLLIGATNEQGVGISQGFLGDIDQVAIWYDDPATPGFDEGVREPQDIFEDFGSIDVTSAGLAAYWTFNEGIGVVATDSSPNGNDGELGGESQEPTWMVDTFEGRLVELSGVMFTDPGTDDTHTATIFWGDTTSSAGIIVELEDGRLGIQASHVYADNRAYTVTVTVFDDGVEFSEDTTAITVGNAAPVVVPPGTQTVNEGQQILLQDGAMPKGDPSHIVPVSFTDAGTLDTHRVITIDWGDGTEVENGRVSEFPSGPPGSVLGLTGFVLGGHVYADSGDYAVRVTVTDDDGDLGRGSFDITVLEAVNDAPVLDPLSNWFVDEGQEVSFTAHATDVDVPPNALTFSLDAGAPTDARIVPSTGAFTWTPSEAGVYLITVRVTDDGEPALDDSETITITVFEANDAPVLATIGNWVVDEGQLLSFSATATDADVPANVLTFSLDAGAPAGAAIDPTTGAFTWTPSEAQGPDAYPVTVRVTDNGDPLLGDFETITITVNEVNVAPVLATIGNWVVDEGQLLSFSASATDADVPANVLTFSLDAGAPAGAAIDPTTGAFTWTPSEAQGPDAYPVTVRVTDNGDPLLGDFETITITVNEVNVAPVLATIGNWVVDEGLPLSFSASATDADVPANVLTFSLDAGAPAGAAIDPTTGAFTWTPSEEQGPGVYDSITVRVSDGALDDFETITVTVNEENLAPLLAAIGNQTVKEQTELSFTATATDADRPVNTLTFSLLGAPEGATIDATTGVFLWTPSEAQGPGAYQLTVRVTDNGDPSLFDEEIITVTVNEANVAPIAYWSLNETSGKTISDTAGTPQNGRFFASRPDLDDAGPPASVAPFGAQTGADFHDTTSEYIAVANDPAFQVAEGSIQLWFETDDAWDKQTLLAKDRSGTGSGQLKIWLDDRDLKVKLETGGTTRTIDTDDTAFNNPVRSNQWYQLTFTFGLGGMKLYLDGTLIGSNSYTGGLSGNAQPIVIGGSNASNQDDCDDLSRLRITDPFDGHIDEVAFFGIALTADQIQRSQEQGAMGVGKDVLIGTGNVVLVETQPARGLAQPNTLPQSAPVTIDWAGKAAPAPTALHHAAKWVGDFVNDLGSSDGERNPNDKLRLKLPAKLAAVLSKRV